MRSFLFSHILLFCIGVLIPCLSKADSGDSTSYLICIVSSGDSSGILLTEPICNADVPLLTDSSAASVAPSHENKKLIAAVLAFPLPFGFLGLHRIYLGTKPYMPFAYVGTIGGCFGILPLIDFIAILATSKENFSQFYGNPKVFMWAH